MLHLIAETAQRLLPAPLHRALLPLAFRVRHIWRRWRKAPLAGCCVIISNLSGDILLLRHSYGPQVWALPGGGIDTGEAPEAAAAREVAEELGMTLGKLALIAELTETISGSQHTAYVFAATSNAAPRPDGREVVEARFFPPHSLPEPLGRVTRSRIEAWKARGIDRS